MAGPRRLVEWPWVSVEVECSLCRRCGRYRLARLAERHGAEVELGALLRILAARCGLARNIKPRQYEAQCGARYRVPAGGPTPDGANAREARSDEAWPPRVRRLGPEGPLPTVGSLRAQGIRHVRICCEGMRDGRFCQAVGEVALDALGLPDEAAFAHIPRLRRFRCSRCSGSKVQVLPSWPVVRGQMAGPPEPLHIPGVTPERRDPAAGPI